MSASCILEEMNACFARLRPYDLLFAEGVEKLMLELSHLCIHLLNLTMKMKKGL